jgi:hypothetical protein
MAASSIRSPLRVDRAPGTSFLIDHPRHSSHVVRPVAHNAVFVKNRRPGLVPGKLESPAWLRTTGRPTQPQPGQNDPSETMCVEAAIL